jgi:triosephosphate isomerase
VVIAYEPVWAIGTGNPCLPDEAMKAALFIRKTLTKLYTRPVAEKVRILYGGSVTSQNAVDYVKGAWMDGLLIGGASLNATEFVKIIEKISHCHSDSS